MGHLKSSALLSSSYLPFTSTPNEPQFPFPVPPAARETAACISSVLAERRLLQPPRPSVPGLSDTVLAPPPGLPWGTSSQRLGRRRHFRIPGASALPVRSPPREPRSGRPELRTRRQRGCGPREAGVVPGRHSESPFPPRQPVGPRSGHTRKWRGTRAARRGVVRCPEVELAGAALGGVCGFGAGARLRRAGRQLGFHGRRSGCVPGVERLRGRLGCGRAGVKGAALLPRRGTVACRRRPLCPLQAR